MKTFNVVKEKESVRSNYKKPVEKIDWKAEFEKAERQREIEKWNEKYEKHQDENKNTKAVTLLILLLGGTIITWYYGPNILNVISSVWNMQDLIKKVLDLGLSICSRSIVKIRKVARFSTWTYTSFNWFKERIIKS